MQPLLQGIEGRWRIEECEAPLGGAAYRFSLLEAEQTLRLFLGPLYGELQRQGFIDVPSRAYRGRVYRLRIDPERRYDRRVRVFEHNRYVRDLCIVRRDRMTPVQDDFLTIFMGLLSDKQQVLLVVGSTTSSRPTATALRLRVCPRSGYLERRLGQPKRIGLNQPSVGLTSDSSARGQGVG